MEKYFFEAFDTLERLSPGSDKSTIQATSFVDDNNKNMTILDIGCGVGIHTLLLAKVFPNATIKAIDSHVPYIDILNHKAQTQGISNRVIGEHASMFDMPFEENIFDIIWAEGSIYVAGFENGLNDWKKYLKNGGYLICNELSWITNNPSQESYSFWNEEYPQIDTISNKIKQIEKMGYTFVSEFTLPKEDWIDNYYGPLQANLDFMKQKYTKNRVALEVIAMIQEEINLYHRYSDDYSYVFYIMKNNIV